MQRFNDLHRRDRDDARVESLARIVVGTLGFLGLIGWLAYGIATSEDGLFGLKAWVALWSREFLAAGFAVFLLVLGFVGRVVRLTRRWLSRRQSR